MTEDAATIAQAAQAQARGEAAAATWTAHAENMLGIGGGGVDTTDTGIDAVDDTAVAGIGSSFTPEGVSAQPSSRPNQTDPLD
jgi:hypothetical protein